MIYPRGKPQYSCERREEGGDGESGAWRARAGGQYCPCLVWRWLVCEARAFLGRVVWRCTMCSVWRCCSVVALVGRRMPVRCMIAAMLWSVVCGELGGEHVSEECR